MDFEELIKMRYSVRKYTTGQVEHEKLLAILEAGRLAPSACNKQPVKLIVIQKKTGLAKLKEGADIYGAPLAIVVCGERNAAWVRSFDNKNNVDIDASIITDHMMLAATALNLGTIWVGYFNPQVIKQSLNLPDTLEPISILGIGYPADKPAALEQNNKLRKDLLDLVFYESY